MSGSATLGTNLIDDLVPDVDDLRGDLNADFGNWYVPNETGLHAMCRAAGFTSVKTVLGPPLPGPMQPESLPTRLGRKIGKIPRRDHLSAPSVRYRAVVHAFP